MNPKLTIKKNIERRSKIVDIVELHNEIPKPTWVELSLIDVCNRKCIFCPKSDPDVAPDTFKSMSRIIIDKIHDQLSEMKFSGIVSLAGYGEPLLHKDINYIVKKLSNIAQVEIVTNGDVLTSKSLQELYLSDVSKVLVSMYDGPEQVEKFKKIARQANVPDEIFVLRDRWYDYKNDFGVKLTNRAGTIKVGEQEEITKYKNCYYPSYQFMIDWNGNIFLCPQDWQRRISMGNMMQETLFEIWSGKIFSNYRKNLILGKRCASPCTKCNANGTLLGKNHAEKWKSIYKI
jgi:radical SAM protein with 4Fe4S-binding SPASM domain